MSATYIEAQGDTGSLTQGAWPGIKPATSGLPSDSFPLCHNGNCANSKYKSLGSSHSDAAEMNPTRNHEVAGSIPGLPQWVRDLTLP